MVSARVFARQRVEAPIEPSGHPVCPGAMREVHASERITLEAVRRLPRALDMLVACLQGDPWFDGPGWQAAPTAIEGVLRRPPVLP